MIGKLTRWLLGSRDYRVSDDADAAAELLVGSGANYSSLRRSGDTLTFTLQYSDCRLLDRIFAEHGVSAEIVDSRGLAYLLHRYKKRIGIPMGIVLFFAVLWLSEQFIWTIDVVGSEDVSKSEILSRLDELGCGVGTYIPAIDFDYLHNQFLLENDDIAWIAVNVQGTRAVVEVREMMSPEKAPDESVPYNLVAAEDGIIEYIEILRGGQVAHVDELVREGELLASGIEQMKHGLRLVHARGMVLAEVKRTVTVEVPLETVEKKLTGREFSEKYLNFFGISMKLFANTGNLSAECDKIERDTRLCFFGTVEVPITVHEVVYREYVDTAVTLNEDEARAEAYRQLRERCAETLQRCELVAREINAGMRGGSYVVECEMRVVTDIAREIPIYTKESTGEN